MPLARAAPLPDPGDWDALDPWQTAVAMAARGWSLRVDMSDRHVWVGVIHDAWHGTLCAVNVVKTIGIPPAQAGRKAFLEDSIVSLSRTARRLWEDFPHGVPCWTPDGWVLSEWTTRNWFDSYPRPGTVLPLRALPDENLPGWPTWKEPGLEAFRASPGADPITELAGMSESLGGDRHIVFARLEGCLDWRPGPRPRDWAFRGSTTLYTWNGRGMDGWAGLPMPRREHDLSPASSAAALRGWARHVRADMKAHDFPPVGWKFTPRPPASVTEEDAPSPGPAPSP